MLNLTAALDGGLGLLCVALAVVAARARNDFLFAGFLWVAVAALVGAFKFGGQTWLEATHVYLSTVARGPGTFAMGVGVLMAAFGEFRGARWWAHAWSIVGAGGIALCWGSMHLTLGVTVLGSLLLIALLVVAIVAGRKRRWRPLAAALTAIALLVVVAFALQKIPLDPAGPIRHDDILHVLLAICYLAIWLTVRDVAALRETGPRLSTLR